MNSDAGRFTRAGGKAGLDRGVAVGFFARVRNPPVGSGTRVGLSDELRVALPPWFGAVGEALVSEPQSVAACEQAGRGLAGDGVSLGEALDGLCRTTRLVVGAEPDFAQAHALSVAWSEVTLGFLHRLSCADPLTGLASQAHLRSALDDLYRVHGVEVTRRHALVLVDAATAAPRGGLDALDSSLLMSRVGETSRTVFAGRETIARLGERRVALLVERNERLARRVALLGEMLAVTASRHGLRTWVESLPDSDVAAVWLLDELSRS